MTPCIPAMRHTGPQSKNHHFFFSLSMNADCDKGILTTSESLCCLFHSPQFPSFLCPLCFLLLLFFLSQVNCNHVIKTSTLFPLKLKKKELWDKKQFCVYKKKKRKLWKTLVSPPSTATLCPSLSLWHIREKCSRSGEDTTRGAVLGLPGSWSCKSRTWGERHSGDSPPPSCAAEDLRPGLGLTWVLWLVFVKWC